MTHNDMNQAPISVDSGAATTALPEQNGTQTAGQAEQKRGLSKKTLLLGGAGIAALLVAGAAGAAIALSVDRQDQPVTAQGAATRTPSNDGSTNGGSTPTEGSTAQSTPSDAVDTIGTTSADEIISLLEAATTVAPGTPVSVDANRDGSWDVEVEDQQNTETTVRVAADGTAIVIETDRDDDRNPAPAGSLTRDNIAAAIKVALADTPGMIVGMSVDDEAVRDAYSVEVLSTDGQSITELDLDTTFAITEREVDRADDDDLLD